MGWIATLTDNSIVHEDESDPFFWRRFRDQVNKSNLKIKTLTINGEIVDKNADGYFVLHETLVTGILTSIKSISRKGIASVRRGTNNIRIQWYMLPNMDTGGVESRRITEEYDKMIKEIMVEHEMPQTP